MRAMTTLAWDLCIACCIPIRAVVRLFRRTPEVVVLFYHSISETPDDPYAVSPSALEAQIGIVKRIAQPVPLDDVVRHAKGETSLPSSAAAFTFDDGYADFVRNALPILRRERVPFTLFVSADPLREELANAHPLLSTEEIAALSRDPLCEIGAHGVSHRKLTELPDDDVRRELEESRRYVERLTEKPCRFFAYPKGASDPRVRRLAAEAGFDAAFTVKQGTVRPGRDPMSMKRVIVARDIPLFPFRWRLTRIVDWLTVLRKRVLRYAA